MPYVVHILLVPIAADVRTTATSVLNLLPTPVAAQHAREVALATQPLSMFISL